MIIELLTVFLFIMASVLLVISFVIVMIDISFDGSDEE